MQNPEPQSPLCADYLSTLHQFLDLAMHTAQAASAEADHRIVLQAIREGTRIIALVTKLTSGQTLQTASESKSALAMTHNADTGKPKTPNEKWEKSGKRGGKIPLVKGISKLFQNGSQSKKSAGKNYQSMAQTEAMPVAMENLRPQAGKYDAYAEAFVSGRMNYDKLMALGGDKLPLRELDAVIEAFCSSKKD